MEGMLGGIVGLVGAGLQASSQAAQVNFEYAQLNWQKQRAREQDRFAQAGREDMFGNLTHYNEGLNKWMVDLSPDQTQIRDAGEKEQLLALTEDAPAARAIKRTIQQRAKDAREPYNKAALGYQYDQPKSEAALRSELSTLMATNDMAKSKADQALIMRSALRMGQGARAADIIQATDQELGKNAPDRMLEARKQALQEHAMGLQQHEIEWGTPMKVWGDIMAGGSEMPTVNKSNMNQMLDAMINQQSGQMQQAHQAGTAGVSSAMSALAKAVGQSPSLASAASAFGKGGGGGKSKSGTSGFDDSTYDPTQQGYSGGFSSYEPSYFDDRSYGGWD